MKRGCMYDLISSENAYAKNVNVNFFFRSILLIARLSIEKFFFWIIFDKTFTTLKI
jgi:hypothetical protein